jgi:hypothetical protein
MASVVLAACRPALYTIVDSRALHTMMLLEGQSPPEIRSIRWFPPGRWPGYLAFVNRSVNGTARDRAEWPRHAAGRGRCTWPNVDLVSYAARSPARRVSAGNPRPCYSAFTRSHHAVAGTPVDTARYGGL